jgi:hypothetical protein
MNKNHSWWEDSFKWNKNHQLLQPTLILSDKDDEQIQDPNLSGPVDLKLFGRKKQPISKRITSQKI